MLQLSTFKDKLPLRGSASRPPLVASTYPVGKRWGPLPADKDTATSRHPIGQVYKAHGQEYMMQEAPVVPPAVVTLRRDISRIYRTSSPHAPQQQSAARESPFGKPEVTPVVYVRDEVGKEPAYPPPHSQGTQANASNRARQHLHNFQRRDKTLAPPSGQPGCALGSRSGGLVGPRVAPQGEFSKNFFLQACREPRLPDEVGGNEAAKRLGMRGGQ